MSGENILVVERFIILSLLTASVVAIAARRLRLPYTVGLVLIGLAVTLLSPLEIQISPQIILALLVPPLVFEAAFHIRIDDLRRDFWLILLLAVPGVILTTLLVGWLVSEGTGLAIQITLVFGAIVSATDPVAVVALFRRLGAPRRLQILLEGESLFNDGTAIVMFSLMVSIASAGTFSWTSASAKFITIAGGGLAVGILLGMLISQFISRIDEPLVETTLTIVLAFGSYLVAESLGVSGVLAVVAAGIVNGNTGPRGMSPTTRVVVFNFWETAAFLANSFIFLLIGLTIHLQTLFAYWQAIGWAILAVLLARAVSIYGFSFFGHEIPGNWKHILYWGGLRGAIALALALSLPDTNNLFSAAREPLQAMTFGVVLFTLLVQGFSTDWLMKRLKIVQRSQYQDEYERRHARFIAWRAAHEYLRGMNQQGMLSEHTWQRLSPLMERENGVLLEAVKEIMASDPAVEAEELDTARREALHAQRSALMGLLRDNVISEEAYSQLAGEVDAALTEEGSSWPDLLRSSSAPALHITKLMVAVIQKQDDENATNLLTNLGFPLDHLPSSGGFLNQHNVTLLIGLPAGREETVVNALRRACRGHVDFTASNLASDLPITPKPVTVSKATIFTFDVEAYEEF